ncbi:MAG: hypothetical protein V2I33_17680 [Kangiellaceae bacterium]|nr:hypothetical protein [Kangiellaceae bacterium]
MQKKAKIAGRADAFTPASAIAQRELVAEAANFCVRGPKLENVARNTNRYRQKGQPKHPTELEFELDLTVLPSAFLIGDVFASSRRHLIFANAEQLSVLRTTRRWFLDGTFSVMRSPFTQLYSIHVHVQQGIQAKVQPLCFILMSGKSKQDYTVVLKHLLRQCGNVLVDTIMVDFEAAVWQAVHEVLPDVLLKGCIFHYAQAVYRHIGCFATGYNKESNNATLLGAINGPAISACT